VRVGVASHLENTYTNVTAIPVIPTVIELVPPNVSRVYSAMTPMAMDLESVLDLNAMPSKIKRVTWPLAWMPANQVIRASALEEIAKSTRRQTLLICVLVTAPR